jgi:hypothetical protein
MSFKSSFTRTLSSPASRGKARTRSPQAMAWSTLKGNTMKFRSGKSLMACRTWYSEITMLDKNIGTRRSMQALKYCWATS